MNSRHLWTKSEPLTEKHENEMVKSGENVKKVLA
jgi:hypothetical protein